MQTTELRLIRGDTETYTITFKESDGTAYDITNWVIFFTLKSSWDVPDAEADLQKAITTHSDPTAGETQVALVHTDTHTLTPGEYYFDFQAVTAAEAEVFTFLQGTYILGYDVTKRVGTAGTAGT
jgi:hypothetical protein